jgi:hypothetical protein
MNLHYQYPEKEHHQMSTPNPETPKTSHARAGSRIESEQAQHETEGRYIDPLSGRPRKLAAGAMSAIQREFETGTPTRELAFRYGVSTSLILQVCYFTHKGTPPKRPRPLDQRPVVMPSEDD